MGYNAQVIAPQLRKLSPEALDNLRSQWDDVPEMRWLIDREKDWRANPLAPEVIADLLQCARASDKWCDLCGTCQQATCNLPIR